MDNISHKEGETFAAFQICHAVVHHDLSGVHDGVGIGGVGGCPPATKVNPTPTCSPLPGSLDPLITSPSLTRVLFTSLKSYVPRQYKDKI